MRNMKNAMIEMKYGSEEFPLELKANTRELSHSEPTPSIQKAEFSAALKSRLLSLGRSIDDVGIVISDKTRLCQFPLFLPLLTRALMEHGVDPGKITFYIAYGTHPVQTEDECLNSYGETYQNFKFVHHNSRDESSLVSLGTTSRGIEVKARKDIRDHDLLITFGAILHHYFAGFGGGRKLLFPGVAGYDAILQNHQLFLDFDHKQLREGCQSGNLESNPLALDLEEINALMPDKLDIHAILNSRKEVCEIHFGNNYDDFKKATKRYDHYFRSREQKTYDMVIASAGGYPKDINFIQAHKSIHNAASFVKDGGKLIIYAECRDGIGNKAFMNLFKLGGWDRIFEEMELKYMNNAGTALAMLQKSRRIDIHFVTSLDKDTCGLMEAIATNPDEVQTLIDHEKGDIAYIQNASLLYK